MPGRVEDRSRGTRGAAGMLIGGRNRGHRRRSRWAVAAAYALALMLSSVVIGVATAGTLYDALGRSLPDPEDYPQPPLTQSSIMLDAGGQPVAEMLAGERRVVVDSTRFSVDLKDAVVAIEDRRFYRHAGLDFRGIARAAVVDVVTGTAAEGGSTITQQLMKNRYVAEEQRDDTTFARKWFEAALAWRYDAGHTKREILTSYLNTVYFGAGSYGAEAASRTYFDTSADQLSLPEAATLAGIVNLPGFYDPFGDPEPVVARRNVVLDAMRSAGYITNEEHEAAKAEPLEVNRGGIVRAPEEFEPYVAAVRAELAATYGEEVVTRGGLTIKTSLDPGLQRAAVAAADGTVDPEAGEPAAALAVVEPGNGKVVALASETGKSARESFNLPTQARRQPGSTFKAFVLAAAVEAGISPDTTVDGDGLSLPDGTYIGNFRGREYGEISIREATVYSVNTAFVRLAMAVGLEKVVDVASRLGVRAPLEPYPATAIGGLREGVTPLEMASSYATIANGGFYHQPRLIEDVGRRSGAPGGLRPPPRAEGRALSESEAQVVADVLRDVVADGGLRGDRLDEELGFPVAGKTGTTERFADAWFVGFDLPAGSSERASAGSAGPGVVAAAWIGYPDANRPMVNVAGVPEVHGGTLPLDAFVRFMQAAREVEDGGEAPVE